jgi:hypothetical protein
LTAVSYRPSILLFGDCSPPEFAAARDWLRTHGDVVEATRLDDVPPHHARPDTARPDTAPPDTAPPDTAPPDTAPPDIASPDKTRPDTAMPAECSESAWHPELIVGFQNRPGQWREEELHVLASRWPLAVMVTLLGSWCEGEPRTGRPLPGVARVLWHQWEAAFGMFWEDAEPSDQPPTWRHPWRQPRIRSVNETWLDPLPPAAMRLPPSCLVAVDAAEPSGYAILADACRSAGAMVARFRPESPSEVRGASVVLWDEPGWSRSDGKRLAQAVRAATPTPVIALMGILRWDDWLQARSSGVATVLAKPFQLAHLIWHLNRIVRIPPKTNARV